MASLVMSRSETEPMVFMPETSWGLMMLFSRRASSSLSSSKSVFELSNYDFFIIILLTDFNHSFFSSPLKFFLRVGLYVFEPLLSDSFSPLPSV